MYRQTPCRGEERAFPIRVDAWKIETEVPFLVQPGQKGEKNPNETKQRVNPLKPDSRAP